VRAVLDRIDHINPRLNCYLTVLVERAHSRARFLEELLLAGHFLGPLHGIPISLKDNIATATVRTTVGSSIFADWVPTNSATVVTRLEAAGAVIVAKANLYEFAYGAPHLRYGPTRNPWDLERTCGGSSNGSASSVAGGLCYGSIGTDTGGSIRNPACLCGVVGLKPTYGLISRAGVFPLSGNLDHVGPIARTVRDIALLLHATAGHDLADSTTADRTIPDYAERLEDSPKGLRVGIPRIQDGELIDPDVRGAVNEAYATLEREGVELLEVQLPDYVQARTVMRIISATEAAEYHRPYLRTRRSEYHPKVRSLLEVGEFIPATEYVHAQRVRQRIKNELRAVFDNVDVIALPAFPVPAYPIGAGTVQINGKEVDEGAATRYTTLFNLTGHPSVVVPCGFSSERLPIGFQIAGRAFDEATVLQVARAYERATKWHLMRPPL
jgi:aspartyl-tRNA(Asn)/glutamyl-tRNA(Gln) amidotransferase subunit A